MEGSLTCTENEENLQKLSKDMKHHIAQLKAELASNLESCEIVSYKTVLPLQFRSLQEVIIINFFNETNLESPYSTRME